jgi:hypothetical protein
MDAAGPGFVDVEIDVITCDGCGARCSEAEVQEADGVDLCQICHAATARPVDGGGAAKSRGSKRDRRQKKVFEPDEAAARPQHATQHAMAAADSTTSGTAERKQDTKRRHRPLKLVLGSRSKASGDSAAAPRKRIKLTMKGPSDVKLPKVVLKCSSSDDRKSKLNRNMRTVWNEIADATDNSGRNRADIFMQLPSVEELPIYYQVITQPVDLDGILKRIRGSKYTSWEPFRDDMLQMFHNARVFNQEGSVIYNDALDLEQLLYKCLRRHSNLKNVEVGQQSRVPSPEQQQLDSCDICCDVCDKWYDSITIGLTATDAQSLKSWTCPECVDSKRLERQRGAAIAKLALQEAAVHVYYSGPSVPSLPDDMLVSIMLALDVTDMLAVIRVSKSWHGTGRNRYGVQGVHLNPLALFLRTSIPCIWSTLSACLPSWTPWLRGPLSPRGSNGF